MSTLALVVSLAALLASTAAQTNLLEIADEHVWSSVSYIFHGEKTPLRGSIATKESLTPFGAQQMFEQGSMFRARYLTNESFVDGDHHLFAATPIEGLDTSAIDNTHLSVISSNDVYISTSALAFMQGLYPPARQAYSENGGGIEAAYLANSSLIDWPLDGYQYPDMDTLSPLDPNSVWIQGQESCSQYLESALQFTDDPAVAEIQAQTLEFYQSMWGKVFSDAFPENMARFAYAYDLYEYASYQYNHDTDTQLKMTAADLATLAELAATQQTDLNGNLSASGAIPGDMIRAISGRMLAGKVLERMKLNIASEGATNKMNLLFGSFEPFIAFFALSGLVNGPSEGNFEQLPNPGAAMTFELFSLAGNTSTYPENSDLWVRFLYRNSSLPGTPFISYPLFGNGNSQTRMSYSDFASAMQSIAVDGIAGWCRLCGSINLFCSALQSNSGGSTGSTVGGVSSASNEMNPIVAGVIGAVVTLFVTGALMLGVMLFGGVRCHVADKEGRTGTPGGFKGAQKMASDNDLAYAKGGGRHERTNSWELRNGGKAAGDDVAPKGAGAVVQSHSIKPTTMSAKDPDDDGMSIMGHTPVEPTESV